MKKILLAILLLTPVLGTAVVFDGWESRSKAVTEEFESRIK